MFGVQYLQHRLISAPKTCNYQLNLQTVYDGLLLMKELRSYKGDVLPYITDNLKVICEELTVPTEIVSNETNIMTDLIRYLVERIEGLSICSTNNI
jgi:hypothetical protein